MRFNLNASLYFRHRTKNEEYELNILIGTMRLAGADYYIFSNLEQIEEDNILYQFDVSLVQKNRYLI